MSSDMSILPLGEDLDIIVRRSAVNTVYVRFDKTDVNNASRKVRYPMFMDEWKALQGLKDQIQFFLSDDHSQVVDLEWTLIPNRYLSAHRDEKGEVFTFRDEARGREISLTSQEWMWFTDSLPQINQLIRAMGKKRPNSAPSEEVDAKKGGLEVHDGSPTKRTLYRYIIQKDKNEEILHCDDTWYRRKQTCSTAATTHIKKSFNDVECSPLLEKYIIQPRKPYEFMLHILLFMMQNSQQVVVENLTYTFSRLYNDVLGYAPCHYGLIMAESMILFKNYQREKILAENLPGDDLNRLLQDFRDPWAKASLRKTA